MRSISSPLAPSAHRLLNQEMYAPKGLVVEAGDEDEDDDAARDPNTRQNSASSDVLNTRSPHDPARRACCGVGARRIIVKIRCERYVILSVGAGDDCCGFGELELDSSGGKCSVASPARVETSSMRRGCWSFSAESCVMQERYSETLSCAHFSVGPGGK